MRDGSSVRWDMPDPFSHGRDRKSPMPEASIGACTRAQKCGNWNVDLGNGLCQKCWDRKSGGKKEDDDDDEIQSTPKD